MIRIALRVAGAAWVCLGVVAGLAATVGRDALRSALPPLVIDAEALGGAIFAVAVAVVAVGLVHLGLAVAIRGPSGWATTAATLLATVGCVTFLGLALAAASSAAREAVLAPPLAVAAVVAALGAIGYGWLAVLLLRARRTGPVT